MLKQTDTVNVCCAPSSTLALAGVIDTAGLHAAAVIVTVAVADFDGSATLVAVMETVGVDGTVAGAVYVAVLPFDASVPHDAGHALPVRLQFTAVVGEPVPETCAVSCALAPVATESVPGEIITCTSLSIVTLADPAAVVSAWLVAVMVAVGEEGNAEGAVYSPEESMVPTDEFPPVLPFTDQVTPVFVVPVTVAVNCCCSPRNTDTAAGETETVTEGGGGGLLDEEDPPAVPQPTSQKAETVPNRNITAAPLHPFLTIRFRPMSPGPLLMQGRQGQASEQEGYHYPC